MNVGPTLRFAQRVLRLLDSGASSPRAEDHYGWLRASRDAVTGWVREQAVAESAVQHVRTHGVNRDPAGCRVVHAGVHVAADTGSVRGRVPPPRVDRRRRFARASRKRWSAARRCWNRRSANSRVWKGATPAMASPRCHSRWEHSSANARKPTCAKPSTPSRKKSPTPGATACSVQPSTGSADASSNHKIRTKSRMNNNPRQLQVEISLDLHWQARDTFSPRLRLHSPPPLEW